jgi:hypothetical protein
MSTKVVILGQICYNYIKLFTEIRPPPKEQHMDSSALRTRYLINAGLLGVLIVSLVIAYPFVMKAPSPYWQFMLAGVGACLSS